MQTSQNDTTIFATAQDHQLVTEYQTAVAVHGQTSSQAQEAFESIFDRYYRTVRSFAHNKGSDEDIDTLIAAKQKQKALVPLRIEVVARERG